MHRKPTPAVITPNRIKGRNTTQEDQTDQEGEQEDAPEEWHALTEQLPKVQLLSAAVSLERSADQADLPDGAEEHGQRP